MEYASNIGKNCFKWPKTENKIKYSLDDLICSISAPLPINQRGHFSLSKDDKTNIENCIERRWSINENMKYYYAILTV